MGTVNDYATPGATSDLVLDLAAEPVDDTSYATRGTFTLGTDQPAPLAGTADGGCQERYIGTSAVEGTTPDTTISAQSQPPPPVSWKADVRDDSEALLWTVAGTWRRLDSTVFVNIESMGDIARLACRAQCNLCATRDDRGSRPVPGHGRQRQAREPHEFARAPSPAPGL